MRTCFLLVEKTVCPISYLFLFWTNPQNLFPKLNTTRSNSLSKFNSPGEEHDPAPYLKECITALTNYLVVEVPGRDLVGLIIRNTKNVEDKVTGISLHRRDQLESHVVWGVLAKVIQRYFVFGPSDRLVVLVEHVRIPPGNGRAKTMGRSLDVMSAIKQSIFTVKAAVKSLGYELIIIAMSRVNGDPMYKSCRNGKSSKNLLKINWRLPKLI